MRLFFSFILSLLAILNFSCNQPSRTASTELQDYLLETKSKTKPLRILNHAHHLESGSNQHIIVEFSQPMVESAGSQTQIDPIELFPHVKGQFYWMNAHTVLFKPHSFFPSGTEMKVSIPTNLASLYGKTLLKSYEWSFSTRGLDVVSFSPSLGESYVSLDPQLQIEFNQPVELSELKAFTVIKINSIAGQKIYPPTKINFSVRYPEPEEINYKSKLKENFVIFDIKEDLPYQAKVILELNKKLKGKNGLQPLKETYISSFTTRDQFKVLGIGCRSYCDPVAPIEIFVNQPIEDKNILKDLKLEPVDFSEETSFSFNSETGALSIFDPYLLPNMTYQLSIKPSFSNVWKDSIPKKLEYEFSTLPYYQNIRIDKILKNYTLSADHNYVFEAINIKEAQAKLYKLEEDEFSKLFFSSFQKDDFYQFAKEKKPYKFFTVKPKDYTSNLYLKYDLNLSALKGKSRLYLLELSPKDSAVKNNYNGSVKVQYVFLQFSDIGLSTIINNNSLWLGTSNHRLNKSQSGVSVSLKDINGKIIKVQKTNKKGEANFDLLSLNKSKKILVKAKLGKDKIISPIYFLNSNAKENPFYISFDKKNYQAGDQVQYQIFSVNDFSKGSSINLVFSSKVNQEIFRTSLKGGKNFFKGKFIIPRHIKDGSYIPLIEIDGIKYVQINSKLNIFQMNDHQNLILEFNKSGLIENALNFNVELPYEKNDELLGFDFQLNQKRVLHHYNLEDQNYFYQPNLIHLIPEYRKNRKITEGRISLEKNKSSFSYPLSGFYPGGDYIFDTRLRLRESYSLSKKMALHHSSKLLGMKLNSYYLKLGKSIEVRVKSIDKYGKHILNVPLEIYIKKIDRLPQTSFSHQKLDENIYGFDNLDPICNVKIESIPVYCSMTPKESGWFQILAKVQHSDGRLTINSQYVFIHDEKKDHHEYNLLIWPKTKQLEGMKQSFLVFNPYEGLNLWALSQDAFHRESKYLNLKKGIHEIHIKIPSKKSDNVDFLFHLRNQNLDIKNLFQFSFVKDKRSSKLFELKKQDEKSIFYPQQRYRMTFQPSQPIQSSLRNKALFFIRNISKGDPELLIDNNSINLNEIISSDLNYVDSYGVRSPFTKIEMNSHFDKVDQIFEAENMVNYFDIYKSSYGELQLEFEAPLLIGDYQGIILFENEDSNFLVKTFSFRVEEDINLIPKISSQAWIEDEILIPINVVNHSSQNKILTLDYNLNENHQYNTIELSSKAKELTSIKWRMDQLDIVPKNLLAEDSDNRYSINLSPPLVHHPQPHLEVLSGVISKFDSYDLQELHLEPSQKLSFFISLYPYSLLIEHAKYLDTQSLILSFLDESIKSDLSSYLDDKFLNYNDYESWFEKILLIKSSLNTEDLINLAHIQSLLDLRDSKVAHSLKFLIESKISTDINLDRLNDELEKFYILSLIGNEFENIDQKIFFHWDQWDDYEKTIAFRILLLNDPHKITLDFYQKIKSHLKDILNQKSNLVSSAHSRSHILSLWLNNIVQYKPQDIIVSEIVNELMQINRVWYQADESREVILALDLYIKYLKKNRSQTKVMLQKDDKIGIEYFFDKKSIPIVEKTFNQDWLDGIKRISFRVEGNDLLFYDMKLLSRSKSDRVQSDLDFVQQSEGLYSYISGVEGRDDQVVYQIGEEVDVHYILNIRRNRENLILRSYFPTGWQPFQLNLDEMKESIKRNLPLNGNSNIKDLINRIEKIQIKSHWVEFYIPNIDPGIYSLKYKGRLNIGGNLLKPQSFITGLNDATSIAYDRKYWIYVSQ